jgi:hypothetical protein
MMVKRHPNASGLSSEEAKELIEDASEVQDSPFVASVGKWYNERGFITVKQEEALRGILEDDDIMVDDRPDSD